MSLPMSDSICILLCVENWSQQIYAQEWPFELTFSSFKSYWKLLLFVGQFRGPILYLVCGMVHPTIHAYWDVYPELIK